ncbi:MAG TPA: hypothetical protein PK156_07360 [Polyangium sp.]|nr:hypothetical protein [Polyangium sp.]
MRRRQFATFAAFALAWCSGIGPSEAAPKLRVQVEQKGDFLLIGNTIGYECGGNSPVTPIKGNVNCGLLGLADGDTAPDIFWRADSPTAGQAQANTSLLFTSARTTARLNIPAGATVTHAYLYWGARYPGGGADTSVTVDAPGGTTRNISALESYQSTNNTYQSVANVTDLVRMAGAGDYRVSGINIVSLLGLNNEVTFGGWWMVVLYELDSALNRNMAVFDGLDPVDNNNTQNVMLSGFYVPNPVTDGKLGVIAFEGDKSIDGDQLFFGNLTMPLSDALNPANDFFNGTRSTLGIGTHTTGDLPEMPGSAGSLAGVDIDIVDIKSRLTPGQMSAPIRATSSGDEYYLAGWVTSIATKRPEFTTSNKTAVDLNGGAVLPGDILEYTIVATNSGTDTSINTQMTDVIPMGTTYVPESIKVTAGANIGAKTDAVPDDQGDFNGGMKTVTVRLGTGATATSGGTLAPGESSTVKFRVTVNAGATGTISNQAFISGAGQAGAPNTTTPTDGNGTGTGTPPTDVNVGTCTMNSECPMQTPICNMSGPTNTCVECLMDMNCSGLEPTCNMTTHTCVCVSTGSETCGDGIDNNCDGTIDNGCVTDTDGDGLSDDEETMIGTDPNDGDSDDDGVPDGQEINPGADTDGDGLPNGQDPDSDNDGIFDGTEMGLDCSAPGTDTTAGHCIPDGDMGNTTTDPVDADTDDGGVNDGSEDTDRDGVIDPGETDPTVGHGDDDMQNMDSDGDGLGDDLEIMIGTDPNDADSDDDGVPDGQEPNVGDDTDGDGLPNGLDPDSDNDGIYDGTEMGLDCSATGTDTTEGHCIPDGDMGMTTTDPIDADTDNGGVNDGSEDTDRDGVIDPGETDPTAGHGADDMQNMDMDGDGLSDDLETQIGSNPNDGDSDDDGVPDGLEANPADDTDGDGIINILDPDADGDGLFDGTEMGFDCSGGQTDPSQNTCIPDADGGATTTSPLDPDTDDGGVSDGDEDKNHNGQIDDGETNPTAGHGDDDLVAPPCMQDSDCGNATSGQICDAMSQTCVPGCRGEGGNGCPGGGECSSTTSAAGTCSDEGTYAGWGNGILCTIRSATESRDDSFGWLFGLAGAAALMMRRRGSSK